MGLGATTATGECAYIFSTPLHLLFAQLGEINLALVTITHWIDHPGEMNPELSSWIGFSVEFDFLGEADRGRRD